MRPLLLHSGIIFNAKIKTKCIFLVNCNGTAMLLTLLFLLLLTILGTSSLHIAFTETVLSRSIEADARAFYSAESGIEETSYWFSNPGKFTGTPEDFFMKRKISNTSFFDEDGVSQYTGKSESPDLAYSTMDNELKIYGSSKPGTLCTVASTGISGRIRRTVTAELLEDVSGVRVLRGSWRVD